MSLRLRNTSKVKDKYQNAFIFTPTYWETKKTDVSYNDEIDGKRIGRAFQYNDSFYNNEEAKDSCDNIQLLKKIYCKDGKRRSCKKNMSIEDFKENHDVLMKCRNIRELENNSDCIIDGKKLTKYHEEHSDQINNYSNAAYQCVDEYNKKTQKRYNAIIKKNNNKSTSKRYRRSYEKYRSHNKKQISK